MTIVSSLTDALDELKLCRTRTSKSEVVRELSIAITATEDAIMRTNRAFAAEADRLTTADVEAGLIQENLLSGTSWPVGDAQ